MSISDRLYLYAYLWAVRDDNGRLELVALEQALTKAIDLSADQATNYLPPFEYGHSLGGIHLLDLNGQYIANVYGLNRWVLW
jgi:hypothetical protein